MPTLPAVRADACSSARTEAMEETGLLLLAEASPFDVKQVLDGELPEA